MLNRFAIVGGILLLAGSALLGWVLTEQRKEEQLLQEQQEKFKTNLYQVDKLALGETTIYPSAGIIASENLQKELDKYETRKETKELILTASMACMLIGGATLTGRLLVSTARLFIRVSSYLEKFFADCLRSRKKVEDRQPAKADAKDDEKDSEFEQESNEQQIRRKKRPKVLINSGWHNFETNFANRHESARPKTEVAIRSKPHPDNSAKNAEKIALLLSDEKSIESQEPLKTPTENPNIKLTQSNHLGEDVQKTALLDSYGDFLRLEDSLKAQTENLENQVAEFKQKAQSVQQTALEYSEPLNGTLRELTQQVSAIREYAAHQQDRVKKLQDGYDWNIIRNFCLRVIRCIDNLENRMNRLSEQDIETVHLKEVRDELVFALESSGLEQFEPEINSDYHGQEKSAEAVKDKEYSDDPNLSGKIAKVIRPGYRYVIDDENVKIVRTGRVKLFG
jgi:hypothetical protein